MPDCSILIADDESLARKAIKLQLANHTDIQIVAECATGEQTLLQILALQPDIIFLDIQMPGLTGLEVLSQLPDTYQPLVIFITAYDTYALQAFEKDAVDYLLKPFTYERFHKAFQKAYMLWKQRQGENFQYKGGADRLRLLLERIGSPSGQLITITVKDGSKIYLVSSEEVLFIESSGNYATIVTKDRKYLHKETLTTLEEKLFPAGFVRIHKSCIVNKPYIKELHSHFNGDYTVILKTGQQLKLSRNYRNQLLTFLQ